MTVDKDIVDIISVDENIVKMIVNLRSVDEMSVDEVPVDKMMCHQIK
jgi:hypothetical protein